MLIGEDYDKIEIHLFGLNLSEPNVFLTDVLMFIVSLYALRKLSSSKLKVNESLKYWKLFFIVYGFSVLTGGLAHLFYNYLGLLGKFPTWSTAIYSIYLLELAVISDLNTLKKRLLKQIAFVKMILVSLSVLIICLTLPVQDKPSIPFLPIAINTIIGVLSSVGVYGFVFMKSRHKYYSNFLIGVLVMVPSALFFLAKINFHPWMDKNDVSHILLSIGLLFFLRGVLKTKALN